MAKTLEALDNFEFVLWEDTREPASIRDRIIKGGKLAAQGRSPEDYP